jgi:cytochrome c oxidase subunit 2
VPNGATMYLMRGVRGVIERWFGKGTGLALAGLLATPFPFGAALAQLQSQDNRSSGGFVGESTSTFGAPIPWGTGLQPGVGPVSDAIGDFNSTVLWVIVAITIFVLVLLAYTVWRFRETANPTPSRTSHNTTLEIAWTVLPVLLLLVIAIPSFRLIYYQDRTREADMTINVQGRQWYWNYAYPDHGGLTFDSRPIPDTDLQPGQLRNLAVDEPLVIPVNAKVRVLTTGQDVIHSWFVPSLGVQKYTIPGRTLEIWFQPDREGVFYGQCNQICGTNHWFMPIAVRVVPQAEFLAWVEEAKKKYAQADDGGEPARRVQTAEAAP